MAITLRRYSHQADFRKVGDFLNKHYLPGNRDGNWLQPAWEYMHSHPSLDRASLEKIGIWEDNGEIVGVVTYESSLGEAFFQLHPAYPDLKPAMLDFAERHLPSENEDGERLLQVFVNDGDFDFQNLVQSRGYRRDQENDRPMSGLLTSTLIPTSRLPEGFRVKSLQDDNDLGKIHQVMWRGFNHAGEAPAEGLAWRIMMQSAPSFRRDLNIVVETPDGSFAAYAGTWYQAVNHYAYVEPVATDPQYRRLGLASAAVLEGLRRCQKLGADMAYVGSDLAFYRAIGFEKMFTACCWAKCIGR